MCKLKCLNQLDRILNGHDPASSPDKVCVISDRANCENRVGHRPRDFTRVGDLSVLSAAAHVDAWVFSVGENLSHTDIIHLCAA